MIQQKIVVNKLIADENMILTDGTSYGKTIYLGQDRTADEFYEISVEEYNSIISNQLNEM